MFLAELNGEDNGKDTESESYTEYEPDCKICLWMLMVSLA